MQQSENFSSRDVNCELNAGIKTFYFLFFVVTQVVSAAHLPLEICVSRMSSIKYLRVILITMKYVRHGHNWTNLYEWGDSKLNPAPARAPHKSAGYIRAVFIRKYFDDNLNYTISTFYLWVRCWWGVPDAINRDLEWRRKLQLGWEEIRRRNI